MEVVRNRALVLTGKGINEWRITSAELKSTSSVPTHTPGDIVYNLESEPTGGALFRLSRNATQSRRLSVGGNFTQADVNEFRIVYRLSKVSASREQTEDEFRLRLMGPNDYRGEEIPTFKIRFSSSSTTTRLINNGLVGVVEGESAVITAEVDVFYNILMWQN